MSEDICSSRWSSHGSRTTHAPHAQKGQMFVVAAIFIIIGFVMLRSMLSLPVLTQEKAFQDTSYLDRNLKNIAGEYDRVAAAVSMQNSPNATAYHLSDFSSYLRSEFNAKMLYVLVFYNGSTGNFSVNLGNFLQNNMSGTLNFTGSTPPGRAFALNDSRNITLEFNASTGWINATLNYTLQNTQTAERFYFNSSAKNYITAFFDITLQETGFSVRSKSAYNRTW